MVSMSCREHDAYAANSQFITHLMGRILGTQGLAETPIDTLGFRSVLELVDSTTADSFDLFYGLYKYNQNSLGTIQHLRAAMDDVVARLQQREAEEDQSKTQEQQFTPWLVQEQQEQQAMLDQQQQQSTRSSSVHNSTY